jgi:hypothetical protein
MFKKQPLASLFAAARPKLYPAEFVGISQALFRRPAATKQFSA